MMSGTFCLAGEKQARGDEGVFCSRSGSTLKSTRYQVLGRRNTVNVKRYKGYERERMKEGMECPRLLLFLDESKCHFVTSKPSSRG